MLRSSFLFLSTVGVLIATSLSVWACPQFPIEVKFGAGDTYFGGKIKLLVDGGGIGIEDPASDPKRQMLYFDFDNKQWLMNGKPAPSIVKVNIGDDPTAIVGQLKLNNNGSVEIERNKARTLKDAQNGYETDSLHLNLKVTRDRNEDKSPRVDVATVTGYHDGDEGRIAIKGMLFTSFMHGIKEFAGGEPASKAADLSRGKILERKGCEEKIAEREPPSPTIAAPLGTGGGGTNGTVQLGGTNAPVKTTGTNAPALPTGTNSIPTSATPAK